MQNNALLELKNVNKTFSSRYVSTQVLKNVNLTITKGEFVSIKGASGSGKSTLLSILALLEHPTDGQYFLDNRDVSQLKFDTRSLLRNRFFGIVFQAFQLIGDLTVANNIALPLKYSDVLKKSEFNDRVGRVIERVGLTDKSDFFPEQLSGGQQQRVAIARALVTSPEVIFADEPTGNLDLKNSNAIIQLLKELNAEGVTICLVTHDQRFADFAQTQYIISDGNLLSA